MYTIKGYLGSEKDLRKYFAEYPLKEKLLKLFVSDEIIPEQMTCFEYLCDIRRQRELMESDDILGGLLELAGIDKNLNVKLLSKGERNRLLLAVMFLLRAREYVLCGLYEGITKEDVDILEKMLIELSLRGNLHIGYMEASPTDICDEIIHL